jgi:LmbE family N-acetylglucosaminyl deacetylase
MKSTPGDKRRYVIRKMLVIVAHPDDEAAFFGGIINKYSKLGIEVDLLVLTDGEKGRNMLAGQSKKYTQNSFVKLRIRECKNSARILGISKLKFLHLKDNALNQNIIPLLKKAILNINPEIIMTFNETGITLHKDHIWCSVATYVSVLSLISSNKNLKFISLMNAVQTNANKLRDYGKLVLRSGKFIKVDIKNEFDTKVNAFKQHRSQQHIVDYFLQNNLLKPDAEVFLERLTTSVPAKNETEIFYRNGNKFKLRTVNPIPLDTDNYETSHKDNYNRSLKKIIFDSNKFISDNY